MRKLLIPGLLILGLLGPLVAASWYSFSLQRASLSESIAFETDQIVRTLANGMVDPVWNLIPDAGRPLLESLLHENHVVSIAVESTAQGAFLAAEKAHAEDVPLIWLSGEVVRNGALIGHVRIAVNSDLLYAPMEQQWRRILFVTVAEVAIVLAIVLWVFRLNSRLQRASVLRETNIRLVAEIAERKQAEDDAKKSRDQLSLVTNNLPAAIAFLDSKGRLRFANRVWRGWNRQSEDSALGQTLRSILGDQYEKVRPHVEMVLRGEQQTFEARMTLRDGATRTIRVVYVPHKAANGTIEGYFSLAEDITELKEVEERQRRTHKLEAIGRLTGGVAHDFNNLLAVIQGNAELLADDGGEGNGSVQAILRASGRAAELTQRLLAYSRQQPLRPEPIDLAVLVDDVSDQLGRMLDETIEVSIHVDDDLWLALADLGQVQDAVVNLALNARDAMPGGGKLSITCGNLRLDETAAAQIGDAAPGDYVALSVSDTGTGMSEEVMRRAFEPFFTTRDVGQGSGLGLSMVEGFARQSGGHVTISSTVGKGTTVVLYLPRVVRDHAALQRPSAEAPGGQVEVILVVEDDADVRALTVTMLTSLGYRVIDVPDAESAERVLLAGAKVDLALSDVVVPGGMSGPQFAAAAMKRFPDLHVVFMSGYSADVLIANWHLPEGEDYVLLSKPFHRGQLAQTISSVLAQR